MTTISILGGLGHVGLPLGLVLADCGYQVSLIDSHATRLHAVRNGQMPFLEEGALPLLRRHLGERLRVVDATEALSVEAIAASETLIVTLGTPLDEYQNPKLDAVLGPLLARRHYLDGKLVILRSTVFPGTTRRVADALPGCHVAICPERILQGKAVYELRALPQIVGGCTPEASERAEHIFSQLPVPVYRTTPEAAELAKLYLNAWRYVTFAVPNAFAQLAGDLGVDYREVERVMKAGYSRASALPSPGFAAGPCLLKDTMQLVAAASDGFPLGMAARFVNERMPESIVARLESLHGEVAGKKIGILGMAFKADNDDTRDSLSFRLKKLLEFRGAKVLCSDEHATGKGWVSRETVLAECSGVVLAVPHAAYRGMVVPDGRIVVDVWGALP